MNYLQWHRRTQDFENCRLSGDIHTGYIWGTSPCMLGHPVKYGPRNFHLVALFAPDCRAVGLERDQSRHFFSARSSPCEASTKQ